MDMSYYGSLLIEALVVGAVLAAILSSWIVVSPLDGPSHAAYVGFIVGMLTHIGFELIGANRWYCKNGASCKK
jgi:outer membrane biosynthesis protein TonB